MRRLAASLLLVALAGGCADRVTIPAHVGRVIRVDTGLDRQYDDCTYRAFVEHVAPRPCWKFLGVTS